MDVGEVEGRLLVEVRAARGNDVFTGDSAVELVLFVREGAQRMVAEGATADADLLRASTAVRRFLDEMAVERERLGLSEFHEETVLFARQRLCPGFWPFC